MFLRRKKTPSGSVLQLTESFRTEQGPRQRVLLSLGDADISKEDRPVVARAVQLRRAGEADLLEPTYSSHQRFWIERIVRLMDTEHALRRRGSQGRPITPKKTEPVADGILLERVEFVDTVELGPQLLGLHAWKRLKLDWYLKEKLHFNDAQCAAAAASVISRLCEPMSENALTQWVGATALPELLGQQAWGVGDDRFYRVSDKLYHNSAAIEEHLRAQQRHIFNLDRSIFLYDLTNTHFEGLCESNPKAKRGKNKQGRDDCPQIVVGIVFDRNGFELTHAIFEGNRHDSTTLPHMVQVLQKQLADESPSQRPLVIVDGGIATRENLALLRQSGFDYLVNDSRPGRIRYAQEFMVSQEFTRIEGREEREPVLVRLIRETHEQEGGAPYTERLVLCKSDARGAKEQAIISSAEERFLKDLAHLSQRVEKGRLKNEEKINRAIGKLTALHSRVQRYYTIELQRCGESFSLKYQRQDALLEQQQQQLAGCYVLRTNKEGLDAAELWRLYITLTRAEEGFRSLKSDLGLRPNYHQKEHRVEGHVFITILAYHLLCYIRQVLREASDSRSWETIRRILQTHCYSTVVLPTKNERTYRIRKAGTPDERQKAIYDIFKIDWRVLPQSRTVQN